MSAFDLVAFDGDDTLWHNEHSFRDGRRRFGAILSDAGYAFDQTRVDAVVEDFELRNLEHFGYGVSSFVLSLIEAAVFLTDGHIAGRHIDRIVRLAKRMIASKIELMPSVRSTLVTLSRRYPLMLITKGDLLHQRSKLSRSGLEPYFGFVEVVSHKTPEVYLAILERHAVSPSRFLMVGNSLKSDILPVVKAGARAVHIPAPLTWAHEHAVATAKAKRLFFERPSMRHLAGFIESLERMEPAAAISRPPTPAHARTRARATAAPRTTVATRKTPAPRATRAPRAQTASRVRRPATRR